MSSLQRGLGNNGERIVLDGDLSCELPRQRSKVVRIFTSSTFTDTSTERNALMRETYPRLKDYCKSRHGLEFQVIDMRWGVRDEATDDHMTSQLCMTEIAACQRLSVGPNFVTFLCQKYGYRPFPPRIKESEFNVLRETMVNNEKPVGTLDTWFLRDDNCVPPLYILQPISSKLPYFSRHDEPEKMKEQQGEWWKTFELLQEQLRSAASEAEQRGMLTTDQAKKYRISVTNDEVEHGILNVPSDKDMHCLGFIRTFTGLEMQSEIREASKFMDVQAGKVDDEAQELLSELRDRKIPEVLPPSNIIKTDLGEWTKDGVSLENEKHKEYIKGFLDTFYTKMVSMIEAGVRKEKASCLEDSLHQEILQHLSFCVTKCVGFQGREDVISKVAGYVVKRSKEHKRSGAPIVLYGESGSGKTSIMAKCASLVKQMWSSGTGATMVIRFLGTSPNTSSIQRVMAMLCKHIVGVYGKNDFEIPDEYNKLVAAFGKVLKFANAEKPLVIFLDSLDQLSSEHGAHRMGWLPNVLPPYVALIVSTLPREHDILEKLKTVLPETSTYCQVCPFSREEGSDIMKSWLSTAQKEVTASQFELIYDALAACSLPLFMKLVFDQATKWCSYQPLENCILRPSIQDMINLIFHRLEEYHGKVLVSRALAYITISPTGLTETELDDILSLDDDVLNDVYQFWMPPVRRIPPSLWTRVRNDISSYLVERDADRVTVIYWYHRQFIETARQRYLSDDTLKKQLHKSCAEYFDGTWAGGCKKPCRYSPLQVKRFGVPAEAEEDRKVSSQPLTFAGGSGEGTGGDVTFNLRKLTQLPFHLAEAGDWDILKTSALCNFDFLLSKVKALSMQDVLDDFYKATEKTDDAELKLLLGALRLSSSVISNDPDQLAPEIMGRLMNTPPELLNLKALLRQAYDIGCLTHPMLPISACLQPPGGMLLTSMEGHTDTVVALAITSDSRLAVTGSKDNTSRIWLIENGALIHTLSGHRESVYGVEITLDNRSCLTYSFMGEYMKSGKLCVWNMETGDMIHRLKGHTGKGESNVAISRDGRYAVTGLRTTTSYDDDNDDSDYEEEVIVTNAEEKHKKDKMNELREDEEWDDEEYDGDHRYVVIIWNLETGQVVHWLYKHIDMIKGVKTLVIDDQQIAMTFSHDRTLVLWDIPKGEPIREMTDNHSFPIWKVALSADQRLMAVSGCEVSLHSFPDCTYLGDSRDPDSTSTVENMYITRDNSRVISGHCCGLIRVYGTGQRSKSELLQRQDYFENEGGITSLVVTPDERYIVAASEKKTEAAVFNFETLELETTLPHIQMVSVIVATADGTTVLTASEDKNVRVWDLSNIQESKSTQKVELQINRHEDYIIEIVSMNTSDTAITTGHDKMIKLWDISNGALIKTIKAPFDKVCYSLVVSRDDSFAVGNGSLNWYVLELPSFDVRRKFSERDVIPAHFVLTPDNKKIVAGIGQPKFEIRFFDLQTGETLHIIKMRSSSLTMLKSGVFVNQYAILGMYDSTGQSKIVQLIDSSTGGVRQLRHGDSVLCYAISTDETIIICGCIDHDVDIWHLKSASPVATLTGHSERVIFVAFSPDGSLAASGAAEGHVILWDIKLRSLKYSFEQAHTSDVKGLIFNPDGRFLVSWSDDDIFLQVWDTQSGRHLMKYHTYAKVDAVAMSARSNTAIVTLQDGRVSFLRISKAQGQSFVATSSDVPRKAPSKSSHLSNSDSKGKSDARKSKTCLVL